MQNQVLDEGIYEEKEDTSEAAVMVLAKPHKRLLAFLIDVLTIAPLVIFTFYFFGIASNAPDIYFDAEQGRMDILAKRARLRYTSYFVWIIYCIIMDATKYGGTFGKQLMDIKVIDEYGQRLTIQKSLIRNLCKVLSYIGLLMGFIWILFDNKRQGWHDKIAKTYVVREDN